MGDPSKEARSAYMGAIVPGAAFIMDYGQVGVEELVRIADVRPADEVCCKARLQGATFWWTEMDFRRRATVLATPTPSAEAASLAPDAGEVDYQAYRARCAEDPEMKPEGTREALATCASMLEEYGPDCLPANEQGQAPFARIMLDAVAAEIRAYLAKSEITA